MIGIGQQADKKTGAQTLSLLRRARETVVLLLYHYADSFLSISFHFVQFSSVQFLSSLRAVQFWLARDRLHKNCFYSPHAQ